jgi:hypothetical protein
VIPIVASNRFVDVISVKSVDVAEELSDCAGIFSVSAVIGRDGPSEDDVFAGTMLVGTEEDTPETSVGTRSGSPEFNIAVLATNICCPTRTVSRISEGALYDGLIVFFKYRGLSVPADLRASVGFDNWTATSLLLFVPSIGLRGAQSNNAGAIEACVPGNSPDNDMERATAKPVPTGVPFEFVVAVVVIVSSSGIFAAEAELEMDSVTIGSNTAGPPYCTWVAKVIEKNRGIQGGLKCLYCGG